VAYDPLSDKTAMNKHAASVFNALSGEWRTARTLPRSGELAWLCAILLLAALLRFATLTHDSLWIDEGYTLASAGHSFGLLFSVPFDTHPALHFAVVKVFAFVFEGEVAVRLPSAIFSVAMLVPTYLLARRLIGPVGALVTVAVLATSFTMLVYANNGRNYTQLLMLIMFAAWSLHALAERFATGHTLLSRDNAGWTAIYTLSALAALYSHNTAILYLFVLNAIFCAWVLVTAPRSLFEFTWKLATVNLPALLAWSPWLTVMVGTSGAFDWLAQKDPVLAAITLAATIGPNNVPIFAVAGYLLAVLAGCLLSLARPGWTIPLLVANLIAFPLFIWVIGFVFKPVYMERIILPAAIGGALAIGYLAAHARRGWLAAGLSGLALLANAWSVADFTFRGEQYANLGAHLVQDWRAAVAAHDTPDDTLLICDTFTWPTVDHYRTSAELWVHHEGGVWDIRLEHWRQNYGVPISGANAVDRHRHSPWMDEALIEWNEAVARAPRMVFLKPNTLCNDGEPEIIAARLEAAGYSMVGTEQWRNVNAEIWER
jgi:hypothetical protein